MIIKRNQFILQNQVCFFFYKNIHGITDGSFIWDYKRHLASEPRLLMDNISEIDDMKSHPPKKIEMNFSLRLYYLFIFLFILFQTWKGKVLGEYFLYKAGP